MDIPYQPSDVSGFGRRPDLCVAVSTQKPQLSVTDAVLTVIERQEAAEPDHVSASVCDSSYKRQAAAAYLYTSSHQTAILKTLKAF